MRGKQCIWTQSKMTRRITPAHAGKTRILRALERIMQDHPRACGENGMHKSRVRTAAGSPPRMRGKPTKKMCPAPCIRITPAHAGKTIAASNISPSVQDHPRACGENAFLANLSRLRPGSPPRMRGKHGFELDRPKPYRITPAHAGKTDALAEGSSSA